MTMFKKAKNVVALAVTIILILLSTFSYAENGLPDSHSNILDELANGSSDDNNSSSSPEESSDNTSNQATSSENETSDFDESENESRNESSSSPVKPSATVTNVSNDSYSKITLITNIALIAIGFLLICLAIAILIRLNK